MFNSIHFFNCGISEISYSSATGLVGYYKMDSDSQNLVDSIFATETSVSHANSGIIGNSATFNGSSSFCAIPYKNDFDFNTSSADVPFSISFWINPSTVAGGDREVISKYSSTNYQWLIRQNGSKIQAAIFDKNIKYKYYQFEDVSYNLAVNTWQHVVVTYDGLGLNTSFKMYFNSVLKSAPVMTNVGAYTHMSSYKNKVTIGCGNSGSPSLLYNGKLDEIAIFRNMILTQTQVNTLYNSGSGITYPLPF